MFGHHSITYYLECILIILIHNQGNAQIDYFLPLDSFETNGFASSSEIELETF